MAKEMKTLSINGEEPFEVVDEVARNRITALENRPNSFIVYYNGTKGDKTYQEIVDAYNSGLSVYLVEPNNEMVPLVNVGSMYACFRIIDVTDGSSEVTLDCNREVREHNYYVYKSSTEWEYKITILQVDKEFNASSKNAISNEKVTKEFNLVRKEISSYQDNGINYLNVIKAQDVPVFDGMLVFYDSQSVLANPVNIETGKTYKVEIGGYDGEEYVSVASAMLVALPYEEDGIEFGVVLSDANIMFLVVHDEYVEVLGGAYGIIMLTSIEEVNETLSVTVYETERIVEKIESSVAQMENGKLDKHQGVANTGKILMVDANGNLTLTDMPSVGASGDIVGVVSENNEIVLTGVLPAGVYTLKYEMDDGTVLDIGSLNLEDEQVVPITLNYGKIDYNNNGNIVSSDTYLYSDFVTKEANKSYNISLIGEGAACNVRICYYDANNNYLGISDNLITAPDSYTIVTGSWPLPLNSDAAKFRLRIYHADKTQVAATLENFVLTKRRLKYTNLLPISTDASGNIFNVVGYKDDYRMSNYPADFSKDTSGTTGYFTTGLIPYTNEQLAARVPFYVKGVEIDLSNLSQYSYLRFSMTNPSNPAQWSGNIIMTDVSDINQINIQKLSDKYYVFIPNTNAKYVNEWNQYNMTHMRLNLPGTGAGVIITVNEPIA